jgi:acetate---CoA ligase (ADP-forming)
MVETGDRGTTMSLSRLLRPRSLAIFGGAWAREVIRRHQSLGFEGAVWPVHPTKAEIEGLKAYPRLEDLPDAPDASFIGVNREATVEIVADLAARGAGGAVSFASGFSETGVEGERLQAALVAAAGEMPVLGPNCYGFINALDGAVVWPDTHGCRRLSTGVALIAQSSNIALNLTMSRRAVPIAYVVCLGNQAVVDMAATIDAVVADPRVTALGLHIEGIRDPVRFATAVRAARAANKPVVALRAGHSDAAQALTLTHTASLTGAAAVAGAFLERQGVVEVTSITAFLETLKLIHARAIAGHRGGRRGLVSMSCSGGEASLVADTAARAGLELPAFSPEVAAAIRTTVHPLVTISNPFDYHTFDWGNRPRLTATMAAAMAGSQDTTALILDFPRTELGPAPGWDDALDALADAARLTGRPAAVISTLPEGLPEDRAFSLIAQGIAPLQGLEDALTALAVRERLDEPLRPLDEAIPRAPASSLDGLISEAEAKRALSPHGLVCPRGVIVETEAEAVDAVARLGRTVFKVTGLAHKTEHQGVILNVTTPDAARAAFARLSTLSPALLVEEMVEDGVAELILGVARDPVFGLHMVIGAGGILAELIEDRALLLPPFSADDVRHALAGLKIARLMSGYRGRPIGKIDAIIDAALAVQSFALAQSDRLLELDINPLIVTPTRAVAVDALIRLETAP